MSKVKVTQTLIKQLKAQGYELREKREYTRKTFVVEQKALDAFLKARAASGMKIQDAVSEALREWAEKKS